LKNHSNISNNALTAFFIALCWCLILATGVLGALTIYKFFYTNSSYKPLYLILFISSIFISYPVFNFFENIRYVHFEKNRIWVYNVNLIGITTFNIIPMEQEVYRFKDVNLISSNHYLNRLITVELTKESSKKIIKCFVKKSEYQKLKEATKTKL